MGKRRHAERDDAETVSLGVVEARAVALEGDEDRASEPCAGSPRGAARQALAAR